MKERAEDRSALLKERDKALPLGIVVVCRSFYRREAKMIRPGHLIERALERGERLTMSRELKSREAPAREALPELLERVYFSAHEERCIDHWRGNIIGREKRIRWVRAPLLSFSPALVPVSFAM